MGIRSSNNDLPKINQNPYNNDSNTILVDRLIGSAYNIVKLVAENIEYIKHTSYYLEYVVKVEKYLEEISVLAENIDNFKSLFKQIKAIDAIYANLEKILSILEYIPELQKVSKDITNIVKVANSINNIDNIGDKLSELEKLALNLEELLKIKEYADKISSDKEIIENDTLYIKESREEIKKSREEIHNNAEQVKTDTDYVRENVKTFTINVEFIKKSVEYTRIYAESAYFFAEDARLYATKSKEYNDNLAKYKVYYYGALTTPPENAPVGSEYIDISKDPAVRMLLTPQGWFPAYPSYRIEYTNNAWDGINTFNNKVIFNSYAQFNNQAYFNNYAIFNNLVLFQKEIKIGDSSLYLNGDLEGITWNGKLSNYLLNYKEEINNTFTEKDTNLTNHIKSLGRLAYKNKIVPTDIGTEGTPSNLTFLRGDGQWVIVTKETLSGGKDVLDDDNTWKGKQYFTQNITIGNIDITTDGNIIGGIWGTNLKEYIDDKDNIINNNITDLVNKFNNINGEVKNNYTSLNNDLSNFKTKINNDISGINNNIYKINNDISKTNNDILDNFKKISNVLYGSDDFPNESVADKRTKIVKDLLVSDNNWSGKNTFDKQVTVSELYSIGEVSAFSDKRLKSNIKVIDSALDKLFLINGYSYHRNDLNKNQTGIIAQEIQKILPNAVTKHDNGYLTVDYNQIIPLLIQSIKELSNKVEELSKDK